MRRTLATLVIAAALAGGPLTACGGAATSPDRAEAPAVTTQPDQPDQTSEGGAPGGTPTATGGPPDWRLLAIVHATAAGGSSSRTPTPIDDPQQRAAFNAQFSRGELAAEVDRVAREAEPGPGEQLVAAVIAVGCDVPPGVTFVDGEVVPDKVPDPLPECFAAVTSVAVLVVPA